MDDDTKSQLLTLLQIESHHRQRVDSIWTQFKDAVLVMNGLLFAVLASLITASALDPDERIYLVAGTVLLYMTFLVFSRLDVERSAATVQADYAADYRALMGVVPPRPLYSRALKRTKASRSHQHGVGLLPPKREQ